MEYLDIKIENAIVEVFETDSYYYIDAIIIDESARGKGLGTKAINTIIQMAEAKGKMVLGYATDLLGGDLNKLYNWYQSFGFKIDSGVADGEFDYNIKYEVWLK